MSTASTIEWTETTWNPATGCTEVSPGCDHCYAKTFAERWRGVPGHAFENGFDITLRPERLDSPLRWRKPRRVFVNSMSDLFHEQVPDEFIARVFVTMARTPQHTYQILTKRHGRMRSLVGGEIDGGHRLMESLADEADAQVLYDTVWPLPNVWLGVSAEDQQWADIRIPKLLETAAAVRWVSAEPLLNPLGLRPGRWIGPLGGGPRVNLARPWEEPGPALDWVVVGGESGPGARRMALGWARHLLEECQESGTPIFVKQMGSVWSRANGADPKGGDWSRWPEDLRVREYPEVAA